jgi:hypothetical protein
MRKILIGLAVLLLLGSGSEWVDAKIPRSGKARKEFQKQNPCPATGKTTGRCPGYVIDHIVPLKRGGQDGPANMQWQTKEAAGKKDKHE